MASMVFWFPRQGHMAGRNAFPRICIALGLNEPAKLLNCAEREVDAGESFFEFRLDYLENPLAGVEAIRTFLARHPECVVLATCRRHQNHGRFNGSVEEQLHVLDAAIEAGAHAVDVEIESGEAATERLSVFGGRALILSYHNSGTPQWSRLRRMTRIPAAAYKIVTTARKPTDNPVCGPAKRIRECL
jgi:3-dehydroquinate dehydratase type I